jgi:hypothetical protein
LPIEPVDLEDVDIGAQPLDARIYGVKDMFPRQADPINPGAIVCCNSPKFQLFIRSVVDAKVTFGENDDARPWNVEFLQRLADDLFRFSIRVGIGLVMTSY